MIDLTGHTLESALRIVDAPCGTSDDEEQVVTVDGEGEVSA